LSRRLTIPGASIVAPIAALITPILAISSFISAQPAMAQRLGSSQPVSPATAEVDPQRQRERREERDLDTSSVDVGPPAPVEECPESDESVLSGVIIVCRQRDREADNAFRIRSSDRAESDYARATMDKGAPRAPDVAGAGIFRGKATVSGCFLPPCPPPIMPDIDFAALPEAPAGSDADRIGRGLPPIGNDGKDSEALQARQVQEDALGGEPVAALPAGPAAEASEEPPQN